MVIDQFNVNVKDDEIVIKVNDDLVVGLSYNKAIQLANTIKTRAGLIPEDKRGQVDS